MVNELTVGYGTDLDKRKYINDANMDVTINLRNGDMVGVITRTHGYAVRIKQKGKRTKTIIDKDFKKD